MFNKKITKIALSMVILSILTTSVFAGNTFIESDNFIRDGAKPFNNPFTYSYEYDDLRLTHSAHFNQQEAHDRDKWIDGISIGLTNKFTLGIGVAIGIYNALDGSHKQPGTLKIWSGEKRQIATSTITGKSHIANRWINYRIMYIGDDGSTLVDKSGSVHVG